jgi:hypothetical protein
MDDQVGQGLQFESLKMHFSYSRKDSSKIWGRTFSSRL